MYTEYLDETALSQLRQDVLDNLIKAGLIPESKRQAALHAINGQFAEDIAVRIPGKAVWVTHHCSCLIRHALVARLKEARAEYEVLKLTINRDLTREERWMLPANLQMLSWKELREQIDSWRSLINQIEGWIEEFKVNATEPVK